MLYLVLYLEQLEIKVLYRGMMMLIFVLPKIMKKNYLITVLKTLLKKKDIISKKLNGVMDFIKYIVLVVL